ALTANTDRHFGNITLFDDYTGPFRLAPAYDMLPMLFAPQNDQIVARQFEPPSPRAAWLPVWSRARALAETYWNRLIAEERLSGEFRQLCSSSL
ncbi:transcriptional regulator, partial [Klebsiella pneumoniae]